MNKKVAIVNTTHFANKGSMGRIEGMISCLEKAIPQIEITILHRYYKQDKDTFAKHLIEEHPNLKVKEHPWFREADSNLLTAMNSLSRLGLSMFWCALRNPLRKLRLPLTDRHHQYDAVIDLNFIEPDRFTDRADLVSTVGIFFALLNTWYATITGKPVMVCSATIGPYQSRFLRHLANYVLNKVDIITLREEYSHNYLSLLGVNKPRVYLSADLAFLLEPADTERILTILESSNLTPDDRPLVGIAPTAMMHPLLKQQQYIQLMAELSDFLIEDLNATLVYITHTYQDKPITEAISQQVKNKHKVRVTPDLSSAELKGIIGICDIFIGSRFHALVASTSLSIPSLGMVAYSRNKFHGIIGEMMGQGNYLLDVDDGFEYGAFLAELKSKAKDLWKSRDSIAKNLKERAKIAREQALLNGNLIKELLDSPPQ
jgi:polysaccharide pyruvyl transferase WcaK-like protein